MCNRPNLHGHPVFVTIGFTLCNVLLIIYKLNKSLTIQIADELAERRKRYSPA